MPDDLTPPDDLAPPIAAPAAPAAIAANTPFDALLDAERRYRADPGAETRRDLIAAHGDWVDWYFPGEQATARNPMIADFLARLAEADAAPPPVPMAHAWPLRDPRQVGREPQRPSTRLAAAIAPLPQLCIFAPGPHSRDPYELAIYAPGISIAACNLPRFVDALDLARDYTLAEAEAAFGQWAETRVLAARSWPSRPMPGRGLPPKAALAWLQTEIGRRAIADRRAARGGA